MKIAVTIILVILFNSSCNISPKWQAEWEGIVQTFKEKEDRFFALNTWLENNYSIEEPTFLRIDSLPSDKKQTIDSLGIISILIINRECTTLIDRASITYQIEWLNKGKPFLYVLKTACLSNDLKQNITSYGNGKYIEVKPEWYLIQKNYNWFFE